MRVGIWYRIKKLKVNIRAGGDPYIHGRCFVWKYKALDHTLVLLWTTSLSDGDGTAWPTWNPNWPSYLVPTEV